MPIPQLFGRRYERLDSTWQPNDCLDFPTKAPPNAIPLGSDTYSGVSSPSSQTVRRYASRSPTITVADVKNGTWKAVRYTHFMSCIAKRIFEGPNFAATLSRIVHSPKSMENKRLIKSVCNLVSQLKGCHYQGCSPALKPKSRYNQFVSNLRIAIESMENLPENSTIRDDAHALVTAMVRSYFLGFQDEAFHKELIQATKSAAMGDCEVGDLEDNSGGSLAARLSQCQSLIKEQSGTTHQFKSYTGYLRKMLNNVLRGELGLDFDPARQNNTPYPLFQLHTGSQAATCIRMGTATEQSTPWDPKITAEFEYFVSSQQEGKHHLYINRQKRFGVEGYRSHVLEAFEKGERLKDQLTVVTIPGDGHLYQQNERFDQACTFPTLKTDLIDAITNNAEGFFFSEAVKRKFGGNVPFEMALNQAFEDEKRKLGLNNTIQYGRDHRRAIVFHLLNDTLVKMLVAGVGATTYNNSCKDDIDRGGVANAYLFALTQRPGCNSSADELEDYAQRVEGITFAPALLVKKREIVAKRFSDLTNALRHLPPKTT